jgi:hypothetical protein
MDKPENESTFENSVILKQKYSDNKWKMGAEFINKERCEAVNKKLIYHILSRIYLLFNIQCIMNE